MKVVAGDAAVRIDDQTEATTLVALQGPKVMELLGRFSREVPTLARFAFCIKNLLILKMTISRTGYTGEDGVEVLLPAKMASPALKVLARESPDAGDQMRVHPCGLHARNILRLEAGMPLSGHELNETVDPFAAGLQFAVNLDKDQADSGPPIPRFVGQDALERIAAQGPERKLVGLKLDGAQAPNQGAAVSAAGQSVGQVTSGCVSPTLGCPIAMAYVETGSAEIDAAVTVELDTGAAEARIVPMPFYKRG